MVRRGSCGGEWTTRCRKPAIASASPLPCPRSYPSHTCARPLAHPFSYACPLSHVCSLLPSLALSPLLPPLTLRAQVQVLGVASLAHHSRQLTLLLPHLCHSCGRAYCSRPGYGALRGHPNGQLTVTRAKRSDSQPSICWPSPHSPPTLCRGHAAAPLRRSATLCVIGHCCASCRAPSPRAATRRSLGHHARP